MDKTQHESPCAQCPFSRKTKPGMLGTNNGVDVYVGQIHGPFWLPCHMTHDYSKDEARRNPLNPQCAGAAIFRSNIGVDTIIPDALLHLPADKEKVFATVVEFVSFHLCLPISMVHFLLMMTPPEILLEREMRKSGVRKVEARVIKTEVKE